MKLGGEDGVFGFNGAFTRVCSKVFDTLLLGFLWILCSLPLVTVGASSTALYYAVVKCVKNDNGYAPSEFFRSFRQNLKQATVLWVIFAVLSFIAQLNVGILMAKTDGILGLLFVGFYIAICIYLVLMACYAFPALSRFDMGTGWILKISIYMGIRYFLTSIALLLILFCFGAIIWKLPMLMFFAPGPAAFLMSEFLERVLKKHEPEKAPEETEKEAQ